MKGSEGKKHERTESAKERRMEYGPKGEKKVKKVMGEYKRGTLKSSSGAKVKSRKQAVAIAMSEAGRAKKGKRRGK